MCEGFCAYIYFVIDRNDIRLLPGLLVIHFKHVIMYISICTSNKC